VSSKSLLLIVGLCASTASLAQDPGACSNAIDTGLDLQTLANDRVAEGALQFETGEFDALLRPPRQASLSGGILLRTGDRLAGADQAFLEEAERRVQLTGNVRYEDSETRIKAESADLAYDTGVIDFQGAEFSVGTDGRGNAGALTITEDGRVVLKNVDYTTCPPGSEDWLIEASSIRLDTRTGVGTAKGMRLRFKGLQLLYAPYLSFPLSDARKSGLLAPEIGNTARGGTEVRTPYYWNIAPNYDATLTTRLLSLRGLQGQAQFRYLNKNYEGSILAEALPSDDVTGESRHLFDFDHQSLFPNGWRTRVDVRNVSDEQYFEDLGGSLSISSLTHLNRSVTVDYFGENWALLGRIQDYQTLDVAITPQNEPYRRVPQFLAKGAWPDGFAGIDAELNAELVNFDRDVGVTGWRLNIAPEFSRRVGGPGWYVKPGIRFDHTTYALSDLPLDADDMPSRSLPIASVDAGFTLERSFQGNANVLQTIEPRMQYVHIPFRQQDHLPVFDTVTPDLNLIQLFRQDRLLGIDRIADTDQLSLGVTTRLLDLDNGRELVSATVGQAIYLSESGVTLPGQNSLISRSSDYVAEVRFLLFDKLNFDLGHQWGTGDQGTTQSEARLQYRPASNKIFNLAYRFRRDALEQGDLSFSWPVSDRWNVVGRYNYSFRDDAALEQFFGLEYESCCWGLRLVSRRFLTTRDGTRDSSVGLQLVLKGLSSVGSQADKLLERGILGYSATLR